MQAEKDGISLLDAKKKLGYKTPDDIEFAKSRKEQYETLRKSTKTDMGQARTTYSLLTTTEPTAVGDVAAIV